MRERKLKGKTDLEVDGEGAEEGEGTEMLVVSFDEPSPVLISTVSCIVYISFQIRFYTIIKFHHGTTHCVLNVFSVKFHI